MYLTLETDYAIRITTCLAHENRKIDAHFISEHSKIPLRFSLKILRKLVGAGIARSFKGMHGGYILAKSPKETTLLEVIEAVEGPFVISRCQNEFYECNQSVCKVNSVYQELTDFSKQKLRACNFAYLGTDEPCELQRKKEQAVFQV